MTASTGPGEKCENSMHAWFGPAPRIVFLLYLLGVLRFDGRVVPRASIVTAPNEGAACIRIVRTGRHCFAFAARPLALITYGLIGWLLILV